MIFNLYSVHDILANIYYMPFQTAAREVAIRTFSDCVNDPNMSTYKNPGDFELVSIGSFDDSTGIISPYSRPEFVVSAVTLHEAYANEIRNEPSI